jgi:hypothetical protein
MRANLSLPGRAATWHHGQVRTVGEVTGAGDEVTDAGGERVGPPVGR